jgi:hypothetical protein
MSDRHAADATLAAFVRGEIGDDGFAGHVTECSLCAARLGAAAKLEVAMFEAAELMREPVRVASRRPARHRWASELALAASLVLGIGMPPRWVESDSSDGAPADRGSMMSFDPAESVCALPDEGGSCDAPESVLESEALAMTIDPRGTSFLDEGEDGLCLPAADGSDLVCPADI